MRASAPIFMQPPSPVGHGGDSLQTPFFNFTPPTAISAGTEVLSVNTHLLPGNTSNSLKDVMVIVIKMSSTRSIFARLAMFSAIRVIIWHP